MPYVSQYNIIYSSNSHTTLQYYLVLLLVFLEHHYVLVPFEWTSPRSAVALIPSHLGLTVSLLSSLNQLSVTCSCERTCYLLVNKAFQPLTPHLWTS